MSRNSTKILLSLFLALTFAMPSWGWDPPPGVSTAVVGKVSIIQLLGNGEINFWLAGNPDLCATAPNKKVGQVRVGFATVTSDGARAILSVLTSAQLSGRNVAVFANNNGPWGCQVGAIELYN
jgi:hypothetical protein